MNWQVIAQAKEPIREGAAATGAAISITGTGWAWLGHANEILQFVVLLVSIATGVASLVYYLRRLREQKRGKS